MLTRQRIYWIIRDIHLYAGLLVSPFVLIFAFSVFALVHPSRLSKPAVAGSRTVRNLYVPADIKKDIGSARLAAVRHILDQCMAHKHAIGGLP